MHGILLHPGTILTGHEDHGQTNAGVEEPRQQFEPADPRQTDIQEQATGAVPEIRAVEFFGRREGENAVLSRPQQSADGMLKDVSSSTT